MVVGRADRPAGACLRLHLLGEGSKAGLGVAKENETEDDGRELGGLEVGVRPELVGSVPERLFKRGAGVVGASGFGPVHDEGGYCGCAA